MDQESRKPRRSRRAFTDEFKAGAVRLVLDEGKTIAAVARDLDIHSSVVGNWVERARADRSKGKTGRSSPFYEMERTHLRGYAHHRMVFQRAGNTGGVPGLDFSP